MVNTSAGGEVQLQVVGPHGVDGSPLVSLARRVGKGCKRATRKKQRKYNTK